MYILEDKTDKIIVGDIYINNKKDTISFTTLIKVLRCSKSTEGPLDPMDYFGEDYTKKPNYYYFGLIDGTTITNLKNANLETVEILYGGRK